MLVCCQQMVQSLQGVRRITARRALSQNWWVSPEGAYSWVLDTIKAFSGHFEDEDAGCFGL
jgi:hypothetical protein